jgi:MtaA/CmuA family methyltransferase
MTPKQRYLAAIRGERCDRIPVTPRLAAWATRYVRRTFREYCFEPEILAEAQSAVAAEFALDQVHATDDPWCEADAYGMDITYPTEGPAFIGPALLGSDSDLPRLSALPLEGRSRTAGRIEGIERLAKQYAGTHSICGWVTGPLTTYNLLRGSRAITPDGIDSPELFHNAAELLVENAVAFAKTQLAAGADTIAINDASAGRLDLSAYAEFALPWQRKLVEGLAGLGALVKLCIGDHEAELLDPLSAMRADVLEIGPRVSLANARSRLGRDVCLAGNLDPHGVLMTGSPGDVADVARRCILDAGSRFLLQPADEARPRTPASNLRAFCPAAGCLITEALQRQTL